MEDCRFAAMSCEERKFGITLLSLSLINISLVNSAMSSGMWSLLDSPVSIDNTKMFCTEGKQRKLNFLLDLKNSFKRLLEPCHKLNMLGYGLHLKVFLKQC